MDPSVKVRNYITENLIIFDRKAEFADDDDIFQRGFVNSLFAMMLLTYIEQEFRLSLDSADLEISNFNTVNHIVQFIQERQKQ